MSPCSEHSEESRGCCRVLLAVDEEPHSESAVRWALSSLDPQCTFVVLHAYEYTPVVSGEAPIGVGYAFPAVQDGVKSEAEGYATAVLYKYVNFFKELHRYPNLIKAVARRGSPKDIIADYAQQHAIDLLVIGSRGLSGFSRWMGSVSYSVLYNVPCSVLMIKEEAQIPQGSSRRIVIAMDGSEHSEKALERATGVVRPADTVVLLLARQADKVMEDKMRKATFRNGQEPESRSVDELIHDYLANFARQMEKVQACKCEIVVQPGDPGQVILDAAQQPNVDLLVMGSRGHGALKRALLGSVVDHVAAHVSVPLLVVR